MGVRTTALENLLSNDALTILRYHMRDTGETDALQTMDELFAMADAAWFIPPEGSFALIESNSAFRFGARDAREALERLKDKYVRDDRRGA